MRTKFRAATTLFVLGALTFSGAVTLSLSQAADEGKPKYTIKEVMKKAHKDGLMKKLAGGQGSKDDAEQLLDLYKALGDNKPPKGDPESWKTKTIALIQAAQEVVDNKDGAPARLEKAANCAECHKVHKGS